MIEAKDILALVDRFENYLVPLDVHVLRRRYNGESFKSTYAVGREMGISDETVRNIENRALDAISHCLDLEANGQDITPMRLAKSFRQPVAKRICNGIDRIITCATYTAHRGELIIFASSVPEQFWFELDEGFPMGAIVGRCLLVDCYRRKPPNPHPHKWHLVLKQPETFSEPIPYSGQPAFFYINNEVAKKLPPRYRFQYDSSGGSSN